VVSRGWGSHERKEAFGKGIARAQNQTKRKKKGTANAGSESKRDMGFDETMRSMNPKSTDHPICKGAGDTDALILFGWRAFLMMRYVWP
jgi:hypothetical protein